MNEPANIQNIQDGLFTNMDLFSDTIQNSDESGLFFSLMAKTMEQQSDMDDGFFFDISEETTETENMHREQIETMPVPIQLYDIEQQNIVEDTTIDPEDRHNTLAWIDFAMKTEAELLKTMVLNKTCVPVPEASAKALYSEAEPLLHAAPSGSESEQQPVAPDFEDWHWVPVNEPSTNTPSPLSPGFSETKESEPHWNELVDIKSHGMIVPDLVMSEKMPVIKNMPTFDLPVSMEKPEWNEQFKQQIIWMGSQGIQKAVIRLHPENLGHLEIDIQVHNEQKTSLQIISQHEFAKERLVQALPQLQEALMTQGIDLSEIHIETRQEMSDSQQRTKQETFAQHENKKPVEENILTVQKTQDGLVDYFV